MMSKIQVGGIEHNRTGRPAQDGDLAVVHPNLLSDSAEVLEGVLVARQLSGGVVPGVTVSLRNASTGITAETITDTDGNYQFGNVRIGPYIVTADEIRDPHQLQVRLWINGVLKQNFNTSDMAHKIPRCIEWVSSIHTLEPGDVLATGTNHRGLSSFQDRDVVELESDGLGRLRFHVRDELKRTWGRETRLDMANKGSKEITTPQLTGKYAARP